MNYLLSRLVQTLLVLLAVGLVAFVVFQYAGDPVNAMVGDTTTVLEREQLRESLGLNASPVQQFGRFLLNAVQGDFGLSYGYQRPVLELIRERMPATIELVLLSSVLSIGLAVPLAIYTAARPASPFGHAVLALSLVGVSIPSFLLGMLMILVFSVGLNWLPSFGRGEVATIGGTGLGLLTLDGFRHALMPAMVLCLFQLAAILRLVRAEMMEVLRTDYIRFAWARGLPAWRVYINHALRNTLVSAITVIAYQVSTLLAFSIVVERVFQWPGAGQLLLNAIERADVPLLAGYLMVIGLFFALFNLAVDLIYFLLDPRIRLGKA